MQKQWHRVLAVFPFVFLCVALLAAGACASSQMSDFDFARYGSDYPDVLRAYGPEIYRSDLYLHYLCSGASEGRVAYSISTGEPFVLDTGELEAYEHQKTLKTAKARLENASLSPDTDWPEALRSAATNVVENVGGSTPYEKLRLCYDWLINNCSYEHTSGSLWEGGFVAKEAYPIFEHNTGVCDNYSAAFVVMARILGYDARLQSGRTHKASGGYTGHTWCVINIHGVDYVFDPQVEDNIAKGGTITYTRFCKTYDEVADKYKLYSDDTVRTDVMNSTSNDPLPRYSFGLGGEYLIEANEYRAQQGLNQLQWNEEFAGAAYRIALGDDPSAARNNVGGSRTCGYGYYPTLDYAVRSGYSSLGAYVSGAGSCIIMK